MNSNFPPGCSANDVDEETRYEHVPTVVAELIGKVGVCDASQMLQAMLSEVIEDQDCPPGEVPANACRLDVHDDIRDCVECWVLYIAKLAGRNLPEGTVR